MSRRGRECSTPPPERFISQSAYLYGMSTEQNSDPNALKRVYRTVKPPFRGRPDSEMNAFGWAYFAVLLVLLVPLLPFLAILWLFGKLFDRANARRALEQE